VSEEEELEEFNRLAKKLDTFSYLNEEAAIDSTVSENMKDSGMDSNARMWSTNGDIYMPCERTSPSLPPGQYSIQYAMERGLYFEKKDLNIDNLLVLPDSASEEVIGNVNEFWEKEDVFRSFGFLWKRGVLLWGPPGSGKCLQKGTPILMYDGSLKNVENIQVGDVLMGDDSLPRNVLSLARGREMMYEIQQMNGDNYVVNESHILSLERTTWKKGRYNPHRRTTEKVDIGIKDYLDSADNFKKEYFGYKVPIEYPHQSVPLDPYFIGLWLGDGATGKTDITTADKEIVEYVNDLAESCGLHVNVFESEHMGAASVQSITSKQPFKTGSNIIRTMLKSLGIFNNKHIPNCYLINTRENRLQLLAGLLDSDGYLGNNCFEFSNTNKEIIKGTVTLARSLGFKVSVSDKKSYNKKTKFVGESQSVHISGHTNLIPTKVKRKQATGRQQIKDPLHTSITVNRLEEDDYYGFEIDGNHRFVLGDFTVTHNTSTLQIISKNIIVDGGISVYVDRPNEAAKGLAVLRKIEPNRPIVVMIEDIDAVIRDYGEASVLALLDGELQIDNVVFIATTNYPERLDGRLINRPSRFDIVKKIGMPSAEARQVYLQERNPKFALTKRNGDKKVNHNLMKELEYWVEQTKGFSVAHLKEAIILVECFGQEPERAFKRLRAMMDTNDVSSDNYDDKEKVFGFISNNTLKRSIESPRVTAPPDDDCCDGGG